MKADSFKVNNIYAGDGQENALERAKAQAAADESQPVVIILDREKIKHCMTFYDGPLLFTGNVRECIVRAYIYDKEEEVGLKL